VIEYTVAVNKLNFRDAPLTGNVIAVLPRGQVLIGKPVAKNKDWLDVSTTLPFGAEDVSGFVAAQYADSALTPQAGPASGAVKAPGFAQLQQFAPSGKPAILQGIAEEYAQSGAAFGLNKSKLILCHFLAQACHESDGFRTTREYWGPTAAQRRYQGRADLENLQPGDGKRYMGRGIFQLTGRYNYRIYGPKVGADLVGNPELAAEPRMSFRIACHYWAAKGLEKWAAANDIRELTRRINGGHNGLEQRIALFNRAMATF